MGLCFFSGCTDGNIKKYNVEFYCDAREWISNDFLMENKVKGAHYMIGINEYGLEEWEMPQTAPSTRTYIITEEAEFKEIFTGYADEIDFENKMVIVHLHSTYGFVYNLNKMELEDDTASFYYTRKGKVDSGSMAVVKCFMVKMDKIDINTAEFIKK